MNIQKLLKSQECLDNKVLESKGVTEYPKDKVKIALLVELGELANEVQFFKYWKDNKIVRRKFVAEEFADCLHFALSLENELKQTSLECEIKEPCWIGSQHNLEKEFESVYAAVLEEKSILINVINLGFILGFTAQEIEQAYESKNKINYARLGSGY